MNSIHRLIIALLALFPLSAVLADGPKDNAFENVRRIPKLGVEVTLADRVELTAGLARLKRDIDELERKWTKDETKKALITDVEIYHRAVWSALSYQEFFKPNEIKIAKGLLRNGRDRAALLLEGKAPWTQQSGLVVRGYRSKIDGSVQPYGLVVPESWVAGSAHKHRLDFWFHGRGETLSEVAFLNQRQNSMGQFAPTDTFVLHPYGRYSNANKFAGEIDLFEALEHAKKYYPIDEDRIAVRGFSMGGAACWQFAVHYSDQWFAASPGAGFSETPDFLKVFQGEDLNPTWYEKKLWRLYDCVDWAGNLYQLPTIAYSGEFDRQKQAADMMEKALAKEGIDMVHIIGPGMGHKIDPGSKLEIDRRLASIARSGRQRVPSKIHFKTYTLRYNRMHWVTADALGEHWEKATIDAELGDDNLVSVDTKNLTALTLHFQSGDCPLDIRQKVNLVVDGQHIDKTPRVMSDRSWKVSLKKEKKWVVATGAESGLRKRHELQGPIDDAFMDSFLIVKPTGVPINKATGAWAQREASHAIQHWRRQFRGEARVKTDQAVTNDDIRDGNLILFGDPESNRLLKMLLPDLPIEWTKGKLVVNGVAQDANKAMPVLVFPNPLNPERYIVLNSGFTYREYDYLNNARQVPKLPDWAVIDTSAPITSRVPGKVIDAGFFDEKWRFKKK